MGSDKVFFVDSASGSDGGGSNSVMAMLPALLQQRGLDPNILAMMGNKGGGFGNGNDFFAILLLFILMGAWGNNGFGGGFGGGNNSGGLPLNMLSNDSSRELIMSAIQRNGLDLSQLASTLNCSIGQVTSGINAMATQISTLAGQQGLSAQQIINSIQAGNCQLGNQLAQCCCNITNAITSQGYDNQLANCNQTNTLVNNANTNTHAIIESQRSEGYQTRQAIESFRQELQQNRYNDLLSDKQRLQTVLDLRDQQAGFTRTIESYIAPISAQVATANSRLASIECHQLPTYPQAYTPGIPVAQVAVPFCGGPVGYNDGCGCY